MASVYLSLRTDYKNKRGEHAIRLMIVIDSKPTPENTGYHVEARHWDEKTMQVKSSHPNANTYNTALAEKLKDAKDKYAALDAAGKVSKGKKILRAMKVGSKYIDIAKHYADKFRADGKIGTADAYVSKAETINELFPGIKASEMDSDWADEFKAIGKLRDANGKARLEHNSIVGYLKNVNAVLNKAAKDGIITRNPLKDTVKGSFRPKVKDVPTVAEIESMWTTEPFGKWESVAKDTFLFSYYCAGARFKDVLLMSKSALYKDEDSQHRIKWQPSKTINTTGEWVDLPINEKLAEIIARNKNVSPTIFGLVDPSLSPELLDAAIANREATINKHLKPFVARCGINKHISFHDARRCISKHLKRIGGDIYGIRDIMGHGDIKTTQGYVGRDQHGVDALLKELYG